MAGCRTSTPPTFTLTNATVTDVTPSATRIDFVFEGSNPNDSQLPLRQVRYTVTDANGLEVFAGERIAEAVLPAMGSEAIILPAVIDSTNSISAPPYQLNGQVTYLLPGAFAELLFDSRVRRPKVTLSGTASP